MINGHGNNIYQYNKDEIYADFSSNIAFNNNSDLIIEYIKDNISIINNYPDPMAQTLTHKIALWQGVDNNQVLVTNGSAEAFYLIAHFLSKKGLINTIITTPSFAEYEDSCSLYNHNISFVSLDKLLSTELSECDSVWLCSPNNPNGFRIKADELEKLAHKYPNCHFILDRAYNELSCDMECITTYFPQNVIVINSFTKSYGIPGLRLGYIVASDNIINELSNMRPPWSVNSLSLIAGEYIIDNKEKLQLDIDELIGESKFLQNAISQIEGYKVHSSNCNFFLVEICRDKSAKELKDYLIINHGILIRDASNFRGLDERYFRVAAQNRAKNNELIKALRQWI